MIYKNKPNKPRRMPAFCSKKLSSPKRLGEIIKTAREERLLTLDEFSLQTGVTVKNIEAIEENRFHDLPGTAPFRAAYLRACVNALKLNYKEIYKQFETEGGLNNLTPCSALDEHKKNLLYSSSMLLRNICIAVIIIIFTGYLGWQIKGIMQQPKLIIYSPNEGAVSNQMSILVRGQSEKEARLTINGQDIMINDKGQFESVVDLSNGVNTITISSIKKHGRTATVIRHVIMQNKITLSN